MKKEDALDRREFIKLMGGGIVILFTAGDPARLGALPGEGEEAPQDFNAFLRIGEDGRVTCFVGKVELGQGVVTSLAMQLADELEVPLESVDMVMGDTGLCPYDEGTWGSMSTMYFGPTLRAAAADARAVLLDLGAEYLKSPVSELAVEAGVIYNKSKREQKVTYGRLAKGQKIIRRLGKKAVPEKPSDFTVVGTPVLRRDAADKVTGKAKYAGDIRVPGMLYARILRPPAHGAKLTSAETSGAKAVAGARVIQDGDMIAVLHEDPELAEQGLQKIKAQWEKPEPKVDDKTIFDHLLRVAGKGEAVAQGGNLAEGEKASNSVIEKTYLNAYVAHAAIETHTALAKFDGGKLTIWASTQTPFGMRDEVAAAMKLPAGDIRIIPPFVGGGFGGKIANDQGVEAAKLAKIAGRPVQVALTRAEEFFYDTFRPAAVVKIKGGVTRAGKISLWDYGVYFAGARGAELFYDIPHHRTMDFSSGSEGGPEPHPFATGPWRAPGNNTNTFARESHIDVLAAAAGMDPLEFRLKNLKDPRMIRVLKAAAEKFGWTPAKAPSGRGYGIALGTDVGAYVAHMCEVEVDRKTGHVQVKRVTCAQDMGLCVNPEGARLQIEGSIMMGLGYALTEGMHFRGGELLDLNFDTYEIPKFSWLPQIEAIILDDKNAEPQGGGEPAIICMGGVVANAVFDAVGARVLELPMTPERIKKALG